MKLSFKMLATGCVSLALTIPQVASAQNIDFGDDRSDYARDGECDDSRFTGPGMTSTILLDSDIRHDATDCRTAFQQGRLSLKSGSSAPSSNIIWGDDRGDWANDGECDDMRFQGPGMTDTPLLDSDVKHDASDCRAAFQAGLIRLRS